MEWRSFLYPLGFLSSILFGARFIIQWLQSEKAQKSVVSISFWKFSLLGNLLLTLHSFIQIQYHVCLIQACNAVISWRNLNLMQTQLPPISFRTIVLMLFATMTLVSAGFSLQDWIISGNGNWFRVPSTPWVKSIEPIPFYWHYLGAFGYFLFSSRFWIQWWVAEKSHASELPLIFWWVSLTGALLSIIYFYRIRDPVNLVGPFLGIVPYIRNIMLIYKRSSI